MQIFRTHLIVDIKNSQKIKNLTLNGASLLLKEEPTTCFWQSKNGKSFIHCLSGRRKEDAPEDEIPLNELLIEAGSPERAEDIMSIIHGGMLLAYPEPNLTMKEVNIVEYNQEKDRKYIERNIDRFEMLDNVGFGCQVASIAIDNKEIIYSIEKYKLSLELNSFTPHSSNPKYGQVFNNYDIKHSFHTRSAFAIISAFSVIEELKLEIRSSKQNPRFIDKKNGEWNPKVLACINKRLSDISVSLEMTFYWIYRGAPTLIEQETKPFFGFDCEWTDYSRNIRDRVLTLPEAIHNASYLRSFIASHRFNYLTQYISPYDVFNVQSLARKLILLKMDLWNTMLKRND